MPTSRSLLTCAALGLLVVTGCGSQQGQDAHPRATATVTATTTATVTATATAQPASSPSGAATPCRTSTLRFRLLPGEGAAGSTYFTLRMTNTSTSAPCTTKGFGGVSLVSSPHGQPLGAPADRVHRGAARPLVLRPGGHADAVLREVNAENYPSGKCQPTQATGLRVYPPDETRSAYVAHSTTACRSSAVHLLSLTPYATSQ